jgi:hypothetical protein
MIDALSPKSMGSGLGMRCTFQVDGDPQATWSEELILPPLPGNSFDRQGRSYLVRAMDLGPWRGSIKSATFSVSKIVSSASRA